MNDKSEAIWNYESFYPLRLNIVHAHKGKFLAVQFSDPDHIRMRLLDDIEAASSPDVMSSPEARAFTRVTD